MCIRDRPSPPWASAPEAPARASAGAPASLVPEAGPGGSTRPAADGLRSESRAGPARLTDPKARK
eukprot:5451341-Alexandrium_andersonii.AAC.1